MDRIRDRRSESSLFIFPSHLRDQVPARSSQLRRQGIRPGGFVILLSRFSCRPPAENRELNVFTGFGDFNDPPWDVSHG